MRAETGVSTEEWTLLELLHGDALWISSETSIVWRQLTGERPRVHFLGTPTAEARTKAVEDLQSMREWYAVTFGGVASALDVLVADTRRT